MRLCLLTLLVAACADPVDTGKPVKPHDCEPVLRYRDADLDGYGDPDDTFEACNLERGVDNGDDCDDADATVHPGAEEDCALAVDMNCDGSIGYADADADGAAACEDCDDADPLRHPGAAEFCDEVDQDCDGAIDDSPIDGRYWYADTDLDGYGGAALRACEQPEGYVDGLSDCDDTRADVNPASDELCNGIDDDCDGSTDDADAVDVLTWYGDDDADGWGNEDVATQACEVPLRHVADAGDCDDEDAAVNPGATEVCNGVDDDCDDGTDDAEATDALTWFLDADLDGYGVATGTVLSCEVPEGGSATDDDCDDADATAFPGAPESCDDVDDDCDGTVDEDPVDTTAWHADADGDGYGDAAASTDACDAPAGTVADGSDCDDTIAAVSPAGVETCNTRDDDCDGATDEAAADASTWYADADGDGFGDAAATASACAAPAGYVADATDCDDAAASTFPGGTETCGGGDEDCDGTVDEPDAADAAAWYADADGDAYGDPSVATTACDAPAGTVAPRTADDCDDADAAFHPGAAETCDDPTDYNCDGSVGGDDRDGDGHVACVECDDADATVFPGAVETCDGVDEDCDGAVDEPGTLGGRDWYADADADGHGDAGVATESCDAPAGYVATDTDCDDGDAAVSPDAAEDCATAYDDDCDGVTNTRNADNCTRWYWDYDGDGHGSTSNACQCEASGYLTATSADDCDDGDATVSPSSTESWGNGVDEDCDDTVDAVSITVADATLMGEAADDSAGYALAGVGDVNADGYDDFLVGARENDGSAAQAGAAYLVYGPVSGTLGLSAADAVLAGVAADDWAGFAVAGAGDVDGDGYADLLVTATQGALRDGAAYLVRGPVSGTTSLADAETTWLGAAAGDEAGTSIDGGGDLDDDGVNDVVVGAHLSDGGGSSSGAAFVVSGGDRGTTSLSTGLAILVGEDRSDWAGWRVRISDDIDGDGVPDVLVSARSDDDGGSGAGAAYVLYGPFAGTIDLAAASVKLTGEAPGDFAGVGLDAPGDIDGDGLGDILVGANGAGAAGAAYLVLGGASSGSLSGAEAIFEGVSPSGEVGYDLAGVGDVDGDGGRDLLFGASENAASGTDAGAAYLVYGPASGTLSLAEADATFYGNAASDLAGWAVAAAGDTDGDGFADFLVGATGADDAGADAGTTSLFLGR